MENQLLQINKVRKNSLKDQGDNSQLPHIVFDGIVFDDVVSQIFSIGPFYYYIIDFHDFSITFLSEGFKEAHGVEINKIVSGSDILPFIHPEDLPYIATAEEMAFSLMKNSIGMEKIKDYKISYNFRVKSANGNYQLYNHQSLALNTDEFGNVRKSLVIHTNINHLTKINNKKLSLIGLAGQPSYLNIELGQCVDGNKNKALPINLFSKRELQIFKMIADGMDSKEIAEKLFISVFTVNTHRKNILNKSACNNAVELVARGIGEGWI